jgi:rhodanese-related sulfurtransferase
MVTEQVSKNVSSIQAWDILAENPDAVLVDVRTMAEWAYVGLPDLTGLGKTVVMIEWADMSGRQNDDFIQSLMAQIQFDQTVLFICRSGVRSQAAMLMAAEAGYKDVINVADGFEGPLNEMRQRKTVSGWCANGLAWIQN